MLLLFAGLLLGVLAVLRPFATAILFGTILAIAAWPLRDLLLRRGLKRGLTATLLLLLALAVVGLPLLAVAPGLAEHLAQGGRRIQAYIASAPQVPAGLAGLPIVGERLAGALEPGHARRGRYPGRARTLRRRAAAGVRRRRRSARRKRPADHPVTGRGNDVLGQRRRVGGSGARHPPAAWWRGRRGRDGRRGGRGTRCGLRRRRNGSHPGRRDGGRPRRGRGSGRRPARLRHPAARAQPDRRATDRGGLGWRGGLAVWPRPAGLGHIPDRSGASSSP